MGHLILKIVCSIMFVLTVIAVIFAIPAIFIGMGWNKLENHIARLEDKQRKSWDK